MKTHSKESNLKSLHDQKKMQIIEQRLGTNEALDELEEDARVFISEAQQAEDDF